MTATAALLTTFTVIPTRSLVEPLEQQLAQQQIAIAHQVEIADDVGATLHIEPNDQPRAGESALAWFALTQKGGQLIPLTDCDCQIQMYAQSDKQADKETPIASPTPQPVDSEGYRGIPGAEITFPEVGAYTLVISGSPKNEANFSSFELAFDVTVAAGKPVSGQAAQDSEALPAASEGITEETDEKTLAEQPDPDDAELLEVTPTAAESSGNGIRIGISVIGVAVVGAAAVGAIALKRKQP